VDESRVCLSRVGRTTERAKTALNEDDYRKLKATVDALSYLTELVADKRDDDSGPAPVAVATVDREDTRGAEASGHRPHATIVDARPEEQAMSWYYYLEGKISFPFQARCLVAKAVSPLRKGETVEVLRMAIEDACEHDMFVQIRWRRRTSLPTGGHRSRRINKGSHRRLALPGLPGLLPLIYARRPKAHRASFARSMYEPENADSRTCLRRATGP